MENDMESGSDMANHEETGNPITNPKQMAHPPEIGLIWPPWEQPDGAFFKAVCAEFVHVTLFIFIAIGAVCSGCRASDVKALPSSNAPADGPVGQSSTCDLTMGRVLQIALTFGITIAVMVYSSATFSGGHLNPAVTFGLLFAKKVSLMRAVCYWIAQLLGAILGSAFVYAVDRVGWNAAQGGTNALSPGISGASGWLLEAILTCALMLVVLAATDAARGSIGAHLPILAPFAIGFTVLICHLVGATIDGTGINPARSFGPAVISNTWKDHWVFWVGPFSGAIIAVLIYEIIFRPSRVPIVAVGTESDDEEDGEGGGKGGRGFLPGYAGFKGAGGAHKKRN